MEQRPTRCESREYDISSTSLVRLLHERDQLHSDRGRVVPPSARSHGIALLTGSLLHLKRWALTFAVAAVTASIAVLLTFTTEKLVSLKFSIFFMLAGNSSEAGLTAADFRASLFLAMLQILLVLLSSIIVIFIAPVAAGSGIPEIKCLLNGIKIPFVVRVKTLFVKCTGVILSVAAGLPVGKEGPMIHSGAVVGAGLSQGKSTTCGIDTGFSKFAELRNDREKSDFISCGAAAGVAAAFGAPIGGVLFCLEEGNSWWSPSLTWRTFFSAMCGALLVDVFLSAASESFEQRKFGFGYLSQPGMLSFGSITIDDHEHPFQLWEMPVFALMGFIAGLIGSSFNALNGFITKRRMSSGHCFCWSFSSCCRGSKKRKGILRIMEAMGVSLLVSLVSICFTMLLSTQQCRSIAKCTVEGNVSTTLDNSTLHTFHCPSGTFDAIASLALNSGSQSIKYMFHASPECGPNTDTLFIYLWVYLLTACACYGVAVPSGLFVPGILAGAIYGRLIGIWMMEITSSGTEVASIAT
eukprot:g624.t1